MNMECTGRRLDSEGYQSTDITVILEKKLENQERNYIYGSTLDY